ncbi:hypothetical protein ASPBRDRAFT_575112 [Aspergillus brasiliensis CBS 101740]|uniref:Uncharacterized protein n=1 Tax=Aspergillus brasiliensis (strain CBS 101740 / IMI 381727 / IBT 21946) TaxID=767769 RepID=A0A1L9UJ55_ASPBC|nr:hypothetical protein ASPBRDRAFT_575112 [Aspergillus brasiliensis CBS 101740]
MHVSRLQDPALQSYRECISGRHQGQRDKGYGFDCKTAKRSTAFLFFVKSSLIVCYLVVLVSFASERQDCL